MKSHSFILVSFAIGQLILLGAGIGEGFVIHWLIPAIDLGPAIITAEISAITLVYLFYQIGASIVARQLATRWAAEEEEEDDYEYASEEIERVVMHLDRSPLLTRTPRSRHKRKRK